MDAFDNGEISKTGNTATTSFVLSSSVEVGPAGGSNRFLGLDFMSARTLTGGTATVTVLWEPGKLLLPETA